MLSVIIKVWIEITELKGDIFELYENMVSFS